MRNEFPMTLFYDGACRLCQTEMRSLQARDSRGLLLFVDISLADFRAFPAGTDRAVLMGQIHAQRADGTLLRGVAVFQVAYDAVGWTWVAQLLRWPGVRAFSERLYPFIAQHRYPLSRSPLLWLFELSRRAASRSAASASGFESGPCRSTKRIQDTPPHP
jgi:predicted DCC family thiol-disulfide oxidoreductase YuxK